jgi:DNA-binding SARP family transcriptional activator/tetratricopeptide (TPR) repeat protein
MRREQIATSERSGRDVGIRIALFGQPLVTSDDRATEYTLPRKTLHVLAFLIVNRQRPMMRDAVAFALFPDDDEETARNALRRNLSYLLSTLPNGRRFIEVDTERLAWIAEGPAHVDVIAFEQAVREGRDADALLEYAGPLLPTIYDEWTTSERERLRDMHHEVLSRVVAAQRSQRNYDAATATAHQLLSDDPWREDIVRQLMSVRYEAGDRAGSLAAFDRFARLLRGEMQAEPMPETIALRDAVLRGARLATSDARRSALVAPTSADPTLPHVGRDAAMKDAYAAWHVAADGRASVLFVSGEAGVGKSRFATELVRTAEREGGFIVRGYTSAGGEQRPYEAFMEALHGAASLLDEQVGAQTADDRAGRLRLFEAVRRHVIEVSRARPMVLVLEDVHWAGAATINLLELLARRLGNAPVLIVATARSDELPRAHPLRALRRRLSGEGLSTEIVLGRLNADDALRAARAALPQSVGDAQVTDALRWVDGVPLLLAEVVRELGAGRASNAASMTALVAERFGRLSPDAETAIVFGAVLGERFDLETIVAATGWRDDQMLDAIGELVDAGFVRATAQLGNLAFAFTHDLVRVAAIERMSPSDVVRAHGLVARAMEAQSPGDRARSRAIAVHFAEAGERTRAAAHSVTAAQYALDVFANADARESAALGVSLCDENDPAQHGLLWNLLDLRERSLGRLGATAEQRADAQLLVKLADTDDRRVEALTRLFEAFRNDPDGRHDTVTTFAKQIDAMPTAAARCAYEHAVARNAYMDGDFAEGRSMALGVADAFAALGDERSATKARFLGILCLARLGSFPEACAEVDRLRPRLEASDDLVLRWEFHITASVAYGETDRPGALDEAGRALALALRMGDRYAEARARHNIGTLSSKIGRYDRALAEHEATLAACRDIDDAVGIRDALLNVASVLLFCGDSERSRPLLYEVDEEATPWLALRCTIMRGVAARQSDELEEAERYVLAAQTRARDLGATFYYARVACELATLRIAQSRFDEAATHIRSALEAFATMGKPDIEIEALALSAHIRAALGDADGARVHVQQALESARERRLQNANEIFWNVAAAYARIGDDDEAHRFAGEAVAAAVTEAMGMPADLAECFLGLRPNREAVAYLWNRDIWGTHS